MIGHYLSNNNKMCYNAKTKTFSQAKHTQSLSGTNLNLAQQFTSHGTVALDPRTNLLFQFDFRRW